MSNNHRMQLELQRMASRLHVLWMASIEAGTDKDICNCILDCYQDTEGFLSEFEEEAKDEA